MRKEKKKRLQRIFNRQVEARARRVPHRSESVGPLTTGTISIAPGGFGFVNCPPEHPEMADAPCRDIFIPAKYLNGAMHGDTVHVAELPPDPRFPRDPEKGPAGRVVEVVKRARATFVGELITSDRVRPLDRRISGDILLSGNIHGARKGDWVEVKLDYDSDAPIRPRRRNAERSGPVGGTVLRRIGRAGVIQADLDAVCAEYHLPRPYTAEEEAEADALTPREIARVDLRDRFTVTIDPFDAKDYDDAISVAPGSSPETVEVGSHIAEVAAWIAPGSYFDRTAGSRGFTAYLPGRTLPMLPKGLTAQISMRQGVDAPSHSVLLEVERATGKVVSFKRVHGLLHVDHRLNYDEVQDFFDHQRRGDDWSDRLAENLEALRDITLKMRHWRKVNEVFLDLEIPEIRVIVDEANNQIVGLDNHQQRESEQLVEECMLAANSAVAAELTSKHIPGLFRVHPEPESEKLEEFSALSETAFGIPTGDLSTRKGCRHYLDKLPDDARKQPLLNAFLRSLPRAYYQEKPAIHFGLGKGLYSHFTSPIRRYPDLLVHQQLWARDLGQNLKSNEEMAHWGAETSELESNNDEAYYAASDRMKLRYLDEMLESGHENIHHALVVKTISAGVVVELPELGLQGFIDASDLPGAFRDRDKALRECTVGKALLVTLDSIDFTKGRAQFRIAPASAGRRDSAREI